MRLHRDDTLTTRDSGMSLVELVVAVVVLAIVSTSVLAIILQAQSSTVNNRARVAAANLAAREVDIVREEFTRSATAPVDIANAGTMTNPNPLAGGTAGQPLHLDGTPYTVVRSVQWNIMGEGQSACDGGSLVQYPTLGVTVTVTWPNMGSTRPVTSHAALAPRKGSGVPSTSSFVAVHVVDSTGADNPDRAVRVTGSNGEVRLGTTDGSGCAVLTVNPSASGTSYAAQLNDSGYVDIAGSSNPSKDVGTLTPGQLNNSVTFAYDVPGTLRVRIVDPDGNPVPSAEVAGSQVSLVSSSGGGASSSTAHPVTGTVTEIGGLWPGIYGGYYGVTAPAGGYNTANVGPGGTEDLDVTLLLSTGSFINLPPGTDTVIAVPGTGDCTAPEARTIDPSDFRLIPGNWTFYAAGDAFECSPGPSPMELSAGDTGETAWGTTTLRVDGAPSDGTLWALHASKVAGLLTTCPDPSDVSDAINVNSARGAAIEIAAGDWYVFRTDGDADDDCLGTPHGQYSKVLGYELSNVLPWTEYVAPITLNITQIESVGGNRPYVFVTSTTSVSCTSTNVSVGPGQTSTSLGRPASTNGSLSTTVSQGVWYVYGASNGFSSPRCRLAGTVTVGPTTTSLSINYNTSSPATVGP